MAKKYFTDESLATFVNEIKATIDNAVYPKQDIITGTQGQIVGFDSNGKAVAQDVQVDTDILRKTEQLLTDEEKDQVRKNLRFIGKNVAGTQYVIDGQTVTASDNAEIFGDYDNNIAVGQWSIAEGSQTKALGRASHAEGALTEAAADGSHVEGYGTKATGYWSHAEGEMTLVTSYASHAEGSYCTMPDGSKRYTTAAGYASHSEGGGTLTTGSCAHSEGLATTASGNQSHVEGRYTIAAGSAQHVEGVANIEDTEGKYVHIAGNGTTPTDRSNAYTLDWDGNGWFAGSVYVGGTSQDDAAEVATKDDLNAQLDTVKGYTDTKIAELINSAPTTLDTLGEIAEAMKTNDDVVAALDEAVGTKANASDLTSHTNNKNNPHNVTLVQLGVTATADELNIMDGVTATADEINKLDGLTVTTDELNYVDGATSNIQNQLDNKASVILKTWTVSDMV